MDPIKIEHLLTFIAFVLPGFIFTKTIKLKIPSERLFLKDTMLENLSYSLLILTVVGWVPYFSWTYEFPNWILVLSIIFAFILAPILLAWVYCKICLSNWFKKRFDIPIPTAWDWCFLKKKEVLLRIRLKNEEEVIGFFGSNSYATSFPNDGAIYLENVYIKDENGNLELIESEGILISRDQYLSIEFFNSED